MLTTKAARSGRLIVSRSGDTVGVHGSFCPCSQIKATVSSLARVFRIT